MAARGERCLGLAMRAQSENEISEQGYVFLGIAGMLDPPRPEVPEALKKCYDAGIRVFMLTGDHGATARTIAKKIGLFTNDHGRVIQGSELATMSPVELSAA